MSSSFDPRRWLWLLAVLISVITVLVLLSIKDKNEEVEMERRLDKGYAELLTTKFNGLNDVMLPAEHYKTDCYNDCNNDCYDVSMTPSFQQVLDAKSDLVSL